MNRESFLQAALLRAPEVPEWFVYPNASQHEERPEIKSWKNVVDEKDRELLKQWKFDGAFDLPDHLKWYEEQTNADLEWQKREAAHQYMNRLLGWRITFARKLNEVCDRMGVYAR